MVNGVEELEVIDLIRKKNPRQSNLRSYSYKYGDYTEDLIFTALGVIFYLVVTLVFSSEIQQNITAHSNMIEIFNRINNEIYLAFAYTLENYQKESSISLNATFPAFIFIADPLVGVNNLLVECHEYNIIYLREIIYSVYVQ